MRSRFVIKSKTQAVTWRLAFRKRLYVAFCVIMGWPFVIEGDFTFSGEGEVTEGA